jgi:hypothetical protein
LIVLQNVNGDLLSIDVMPEGGNQPTSFLNGPIRLKLPEIHNTEMPAIVDQYTIKQLDESLDSHSVNEDDYDRWSLSTHVFELLTCREDDCLSLRLHSRRDNVDVEPADLTFSVFSRNFKRYEDGREDLLTLRPINGPHSLIIVHLPNWFDEDAQMTIGLNRVNYNGLPIAVFQRFGSYGLNSGPLWLIQKAVDRLAFPDQHLQFTKSVELEIYTQSIQQTRREEINVTMMLARILSHVDYFIQLRGTWEALNDFHLSNDVMNFYELIGRLDEADITAYLEYLSLRTTDFAAINIVEDPDYLAIGEAIDGMAARILNSRVELQRALRETPDDQAVLDWWGRTIINLTNELQMLVAARNGAVMANYIEPPVIEQVEDEILEEMEGPNFEVSDAGF